MGSRVSFRIAVSIFGVLGFLSLAATGDVSPPDFGAPLPGLTADQLARFQAGQTNFQEVEGVSEGLGPVFNDVSCASCHNVAAVGGGSARLETRFGTLTSTGLFDPLSQFGGSLIQEQGIGATGSCEYLAELVPPQATIVAKRRTTPLFGLGLVDAVPDAAYLAIAIGERFASPDTAGVPSIVTNLATQKPAVGKFGWKGQNPSLFQFSADAYLNEMGVTSALFPNENCPQGDCASLSCNPDPGINDIDNDVQNFTDFMTFLAPPPRGPITPTVANGENIFHSIGCASCHLATLRTGSNAVAALDRITFHPYSDFLLHDMGSLGDGITQNKATGRLMRTAPLWGLRKQTTLLHDGRATTLDQAILAHDGQGRRARMHYQRLLDWQKSQLIAFLDSL